METVHLDLKKYLLRNIFPSRTVLVFPPFNGFRRFLIHKLIEDTFASADVVAFSIGQDISRRIVVCYKGLLRDVQNKGIAASLPKNSGRNMIEKERQSRQKLTPTAAVYKPPAARIAESRRSTDDAKPSDSKRNRVRRPDQQMYVPRPKRASYGTEQPRSRSRSSSRTSLESESCYRRNKSSPDKSEDSRLSGSNEPINYLSDEKDNKTSPSAKISNNSLRACRKDNNVPSCSVGINSTIKTMKGIPMAENNNKVSRPRVDETYICNDLTQPCTDIHTASSNKLIETVADKKIPISEKYLHTNTNGQFDCTQSDGKHETEERETVGEMQVDCLEYDTNCALDRDKSTTKSDVKDISEIDNYGVMSENEANNLEKAIQNNSSDLNESRPIEDEKAAMAVEVSSSKVHDIETISLSSDSKDSSENPMTSSNDSKSNDSSSDSDVQRRKSYENMEIEHSTNSEEKKKDLNSDRRNSKEQNLKNRRIFPTVAVSDVLIISDTSSSNESSDTSKEYENNLEIRKERAKKMSTTNENKSENPVSKSKSVDPGECDWESLYDDSGECLVPNLMEELTNSVGRVRVTSVDSDYRPFQSIEERVNDGECIIEIYDFPAEFKTTDLFNIFAAYRNKNFQIKWVDDTHALGVFPSPLMADEVLACTLPFVKTRPLRLGIVESRNKARNLVLPPLPSMERPKTCTALARRLVSGALGLRLPTSSQEREKEKQVLKEAREKRRLEAKQKEAAWDGTLTSSNCI